MRDGDCSFLPASSSKWSSNQELAVLHASQLKSSSEGVICMCRASFTNSSCPLPWSSTVVSSQWIRWWFSHTCSTTADFSVIPLSQASWCSFSLVSSLRLVSLMKTWSGLHWGDQMETYAHLNANLFTLSDELERSCWWQHQS